VKYFVCTCSNRVIQHYTSNPLKAYTGDIPSPIISIQYILREDQEHTGNSSGGRRARRGGGRGIIPVITQQ